MRVSYPTRLATVLLFLGWLGGTGVEGGDSSFSKTSNSTPASDGTTSPLENHLPDPAPLGPIPASTAASRQQMEIYFALNIQSYFPPSEPVGYTNPPNDITTSVSINNTSYPLTFHGTSGASVGSTTNNYAGWGNNTSPQQVVQTSQWLNISWPRIAPPSFVPTFPGNYAIYYGWNIYGQYLVSSFVPATNLGLPYSYWNYMSIYGDSAYGGNGGYGGQVNIFFDQIMADVDSTNVQGYGLPLRNQAEAFANDWPNPQYNTVLPNNPTPPSTPASQQPPGKIIQPDTGDTDGDGIPDFADGYSLPGTGPAGAKSYGSRFYPLVVQIPNAGIPVMVTLGYSASNPLQVTVSGTAPNQTFHPDPNGNLRVWLKNGYRKRNGHTLANGGDYIDPNTAYTPTQLGCPSPNGGTILLYVEAVSAPNSPVVRNASVGVKVSSAPNAPYDYHTLLAPNLAYAMFTLLPAEFAPNVLPVNSSFNEWKVNSTTGYAQPDNYDESLTIASGTNTGKLATTNLHQNFFGIKPGTMPASFYQNATVTITKLNKPDADDGLTTPEPGTIRLYAIQNVGQSGATSYPIPISLPGQTLPNSTVPFTTSISTSQPANLVPVLYSSSATIPQGSNVTYWMEGVDPGPITLEYRIHFTASGSTPDVVVDQHFLVCTQQSKAAWQQDIRQEILVQTSQPGTTGTVDMNNYVVANGFMADRTYVQCVYGYYQELFDEEPNTFYWPGLAKLAGAPVYAGLSDMQWAITGPTEILDSLGDISTYPGVPSPGALTTAECLQLQKALLDGNFDIFSDMAWQFRAYQASGVWAMRYVSANNLDKASPSDRKIDEGDWEQLFQGQLNSDTSAILAVNFDLTQREQEFAVQPAWDEIAAVPDGAYLFSQLAVSPVDISDKAFEEVVPDGDITIFDNNRWVWVTDPDYGIWHDWTALSPSDQASVVDVPLTTRAATYSFVSTLTWGVFPLW